MAKEILAFAEEGEMAAFCRLCYDDKDGTESPSFVACNNCGSFCCSEHYTFWEINKNAFCVTCFQDQAGEVIAGCGDTIHSVEEKENLYHLLTLINEDSELKNIFDQYQNKPQKMSKTLQQIFKRLGELLKNKG